MIDVGFYGVLLYLELGTGKWNAKQQSTMLIQLLDKPIWVSC